MDLKSFWYVVALASELTPGVVLGRKVLGEWLAVFRGEDGAPAALRDRCMHRASRLSLGTVKDGCLQCPYHGWTYDAGGQVVAVPAEGDDYKELESRRTLSYPTREEDGYVYVCLTDPAPEGIEPFPMPRYGEPGWHTIRVINRFANDVTNCAENFIDIPHTVSVHPGIFRDTCRQQLTAEVVRRDGQVHCEYKGETVNLGMWTRFLNPSGAEIRHIDRFYMPNVTSVEYDLGPARRFFITSQSVPEEDDSTLVYTDVTYDYGIWSRLARPLVHWTTQRIIDQDLVALKVQGEVIRKYGGKFANTAADAIHVFVESIRNELREGRDPRALPEKTVPITFWV